MELSILIINHDGQLHLKRCLESVFHNTVHRPFEVIVVDNASRDQSLEMLARDFPETRVIALRENVGFARANNLAINEAKGRFLVLLNNDTLIEPGAIDAMLCLMRERPDVGALGPLLRNQDRSVQISFGQMLGFRTELFQKILCARYEAGGSVARRYVERRSRRECHPDWVSGACLMLRADLLEKTGLLDESFFMYAEDVDLCHRVRKLGYRVLYTPRAEVIHLRGKSAEANPDKIALEYRRSQLYFYLKHYGRTRVRLLKVYLLAKTTLGWVLSRPAQRPHHRRLVELVWNF